MAEVRCHLNARTGILVIDLRTGDVLHWLRVTGMIAELYVAVALSGVVRPMALGFRTQEVQRMITVGPSGTISMAQELQDPRSTRQRDRDAQ